MAATLPIKKVRTKPGMVHPVHVPGVLVVDRLDPEDVLAAEQHGHGFVEDPRELPAGFDPDDRHRPSPLAGSLADRELDGTSDAEVTAGTADGRVPFGVAVKVAEPGPRLLDGARDLHVVAVLEQVSLLR
jgi:hypothetical protein